MQFGPTHSSHRHSIQPKEFFVVLILIHSSPASKHPILLVLDVIVSVFTKGCYVLPSNKGSHSLDQIGALDGGSPMSHVEFKK